VNKKKILFLSDDIRMHTGVSRITNSIIINTLGTFDWVQYAVNPNSTTQNIVDVSKSASNISKIRDASLLLYETKTYENLNLLHQVLDREEPDAIIHMTDPHRWNWLYQHENYIRKNIPLLYYHVWDNEPFPKFLKNVYDSCDWIGCISKLTEDCVNNVSPEHTSVTYIPHGVDTKKFFKQDSSIVTNNKKRILGRPYDYVIFCNNSNIQRKQLTNLIEGYADFVKNTSIPKNKILLIIHTNIENKLGCDLDTLVDDLYYDLPVKFSTSKLSDEQLNDLYNVSDVTMNVSSCEGFGLSTLESVASNTPIIINYTGGLKDQYCQDHCIKIDSSVRLLSFTQLFPYIYSYICDPTQISNALQEMYDSLKNKKVKNRFLTKNRFTETQMIESIKQCILQTIEDHNPTQSFRFLEIK